MAAQPTRFLVLVYRMPAKPTAGRIAVWRHLKKIGAIYIQQSVCVFPDQTSVRADLQGILNKIVESAGEYHLLPVRTLSASEQQKLVDQFRDQTAKHYAEIIENCEVNFHREIEFEIFRNNLTYEEAEEIRVEFEKISNWFERVKGRDWFGAPNQEEASRWIARCEQLVEDFEGRVFAAQEAAESGTSQPGLTSHQSVGGRPSSTARTRARATSRSAERRGQASK